MTLFMVKDTTILNNLGIRAILYVVGMEKTNFALALMKTQQVLQRLHTLLNRLSVREGFS